MRTFLKATILLVLFIAPGAAQQITLNLDSVQDRRSGSGTYLPGHPEKLTSPLVDTTLTFKVGGPALRQVRYYGYGLWHITHAVDDLGNQVDKMEVGCIPDDGKCTWKSFMVNSPTIDCTLTNTKRQATRLVQVQGDCSFLVGGRSQVITIPHFKSLIGKTLNHPSLKAAGLKITVLPASKTYSGWAPAANIVRIVIKGDQTHLDDNIGYFGLEIINRAGQYLMQGAVGGEDWYLSRPPDNAMTLRIHLLFEMKKVIVPFDLHDVALP
ncbi:MAG: hypothetical protein JO316_09640 [Abitibacteriaceae bacterium]|nr:hypothetical protein [Abditibacteriaceae bacterium]